MDDLDEELAGLGFGCQWDEIKLSVAARKTVTNVSDIERLEEHHRRFPEMHRQAKRKWAERRAAEFRERGDVMCNDCGKKMSWLDHANYMPGVCLRCRKKMKGESK